jgi:hypothetical protein
LHRLGRAIHEDFIGDPNQFVEPPLGAYLNEHRAMMVSKADIHRFTLYQSDFVRDGTGFSSSGAKRITLMATRLPGWLGPIVIEWTPGKPELAEARKNAVVAALQANGHNIVAERVAVGPSPYNGMLGADAAHNYDTMLFRDFASARGFSVSPTSTATLGAGGR